LNTVHDLRNQLTSFVITVGDEPNLSECLACLDAQSVEFQRETIRDAAPMHRAFNEMHQRCRTPEFIQVDEDMLLFPDAVERLHRALAEAPTETAIIAAPLWDVQVERPIYGVKIHRTEIVARFPHRDTVSCEVAHNKELTEAGFAVQSLPLAWSREACFGLHGKNYTPDTAFVRWKRLFIKRRLTGRPLWAAPWPARFLDRYQRTGSQIDLYSFLGAVSALSEQQPSDNELDFRDRGEDFERIRTALESDLRGRETIREVGEAARTRVDRWTRWLRRRIGGGR